MKDETPKASLESAKFTVRCWKGSQNTTTYCKGDKTVSHSTTWRESTILVTTKDGELPIFDVKTDKDGSKYVDLNSPGEDLEGGNISACEFGGSDDGWVDDWNYENIDDDEQEKIEAIFEDAQFDDRESALDSLGYSEDDATFVGFIMLSVKGSGREANFNIDTGKYEDEAVK